MYIIDLSEEQKETLLAALDYEVGRCELELLRLQKLPNIKRTKAQFLQNHKCNCAHMYKALKERVTQSFAETYWDSAVAALRRFRESTRKELHNHERNGALFQKRKDNAKYFMEALPLCKHIMDHQPQKASL